MDHYFNYYDLTEGKKVIFTWIKLTEQVKLYWTKVKSQIDRTTSPQLLGTKGGIDREVCSPHLSGTVN